MPVRNRLDIIKAKIIFSSSSPAALSGKKTGWQFSLLLHQSRQQIIFIVCNSSQNLGHQLPYRLHSFNKLIPF